MNKLQLLALLSLTTAQTVTVYPPRTTTSVSTPATITITKPIISSGVHDYNSNQTITAISDCHYHDSTQFCLANDVEGYVIGAPSKTQDAPSVYTDCHAHAEETFCVSPLGEEVKFIIGTEEEANKKEEEGENCHFHGGIEHCTGGSRSITPTCSKVDRDYNTSLRIGLIFVIFFTSAIGAYGPVILNKILNISSSGIIFIIMKQFGTGVIISTAFVHLITHSNLIWTNDCIGELDYEGTSSALTMAGIFLAFILEYGIKRMLSNRNQILATTQKNDNSIDEASGEDMNAVESKEKDLEMNHSNTNGLLNLDDTLSVVTMELGIIFHSILIGITLVVAGDSFFITLFIVILFHQVFEGIALGSRIAYLKDCGLLKKCIMAGAFSITTPIGMAIGIGVLSKFNGNDKSTLIVLGTLDSFSAGVLIWTGLVEMWCNDWLFGALAGAGIIRTVIGLASLMTGMILMSVLGKWA